MHARFQELQPGQDCTTIKTTTRSIILGTAPQADWGHALKRDLQHVRQQFVQRAAAAATRRRSRGNVVPKRDPNKVCKLSKRRWATVEQKVNNKGATKATTETTATIFNVFLIRCRHFVAFQADAALLLGLSNGCRCVCMCVCVCASLFMYSFAALIRIQMQITNQFRVSSLIFVKFTWPSQKLSS